MPKSTHGFVAASGGPISDPYFASVVHGAHYDGADASTTIVDVTGRSWTAAGNAQLDTAQSKFGGSSVLFDGTGDRYYRATETAFDFASGDMTIEFFVRLTRNTNESLVSFGINSVNWTAASHWAWDVRMTASAFQFGYSRNGVQSSVGISGTPSLNVWHHVVAIADAGAMRIILNGGTPSGAIVTGPFQAPAAGWELSVGMRASGENPFWGWIDDLRITKGVCRYPSGVVTVPTLPFPDR